MSTWERRWRAGLTAVLAVYGWQILRTPGRFRWLDSLDLAIHEAGHVLFGPAGELPGVLGGTLAQLLIPAAFVVALWRQGDRHGASVPLWWLGQNCWNIAVYVKDARSQLLPLVGGGEHDWALLLGQAGLLHRDFAIGNAVALTGFLVYTGSIILGVRALTAPGPPRVSPGPSSPGAVGGPATFPE